MILSDRLNILVGHDFIIYTGTGDPPIGRLSEVGYDYITIATKKDAEGGFAEEGADWFVSLHHIVSMVHIIPECAGCAVEEAAKGGQG